MKKSDYSDIIDHPHHQSPTRPQMSMQERAAQFSPFAALVGYDEEVKEAGRLTDERVFLEEDAVRALNEKLSLLSEQLSEKPQVCIRYYVPDARKEGGAYRDITGTIRKIDVYEQSILMSDGTKIHISDITDIL